MPAVAAGIPKDCRARHAGRDLLEQFEPFRAEAIFVLGKSGGIPARSRQALDEAGADRIDDLREHNRDGAGRLQQRPHGCAASGHDDVRRERGQFRHVSADVVGLAHGPANSIRTLRPSVQPNCCKPCRNAPMRACPSASSVVISTPMRRIRSGCCARAANGHAAAAPPSSVMNSRRFIRSPRRPALATCRGFRGRAPSRS